MKKAFDKMSGVHFGLFFSQFEWFHRLYLADKAANFATNSYVTVSDGV